MSTQFDPPEHYENWKRWRSWCQHMCSPLSYVDFGWLFTVASAIQRRVWIGRLDGMPLFANCYIIFIGTSGVGKGMILSEVSGMLSYHKYRVAKSVDEVDRLEDIKEPKLLFSMAPHDITYEALTRHLAQAIRPFKYANNGKSMIYSHSSMAAVLEELGTLFKKRENQGMGKFLLQVFDCKDYNYVTQTRGSAIIRSPWLSILAGCTPKFLPEGIQQGILEDGTVSRMLFLFETTPRPTPFFLVQPDDTAIAGRKLLLDHLLKLSKLFGEVTFEPAAHTFLETFNRDLAKKILSFSTKMESYFARIKVHLQKLAMAVHFSDSLDLTITLDDVQTAARLLGSIERKMDIGFSAAGRNQFAGVTKEILQFVAARNGEYVSLADLLDRFSADLTYEELDKQLTELTLMDKLIQKDGQYAHKSIR